MSTVLASRPVGAFIHRCGVQATKCVGDNPELHCWVVPAWAMTIMRGCKLVEWAALLGFRRRKRAAMYALRRANKDRAFREAALAAAEAGLLLNFIQQQKGSL